MTLYDLQNFYFIVTRPRYLNSAFNNTLINKWYWNIYCNIWRAFFILGVKIVSIQLPKVFYIVNNCSYICENNFPTYSLFICRTITANKSYMLFYLVIMIKIQFIWTWLIDCSLTYRNKYFMHIQGKNKINYRETVSWTWVSEWLLFNSNSAISQLYHSENKLIFNEIMMRSTLY
jgi:hypothetical protein